MRFTKAQATGNDFVMVSDPEATLDLSASTVAWLCDRHFGIGADGLIRAVPAHKLPDGVAALTAAGLTSTDQSPLWFMDYRNGDGSDAEMCGNGVRAFAHFLLDEELLELNDSESIPVLTRAGLRTVRRVTSGYAVGMGVWSFIDPQMAAESASDSLVRARGLTDPRPALSISMGNPHTVVALPDEAALQKLDLHHAPTVDPTPPQGTNVEFVVPADPLVTENHGRVRMRVHERGVGETLSCGTGTCAAAAAVRVWAGADAVNTWTVAVPGGEVTVRFIARTDGAEDVELAGPAELVYSGDISLPRCPAQLASHA
ncbi:diaminopimelate epimerase [Nesterenkonia sphaerica]|uniref:Diaminopimelate epimerase n=1 Tax=Nesterenkonia sphaerica TaxID=1804988 RepID=A0A5R9A9S1_9MICC|nr:diaminopimelate epimerase [Nesterenkonia sphaerica]TLP75522.1 diaminopimelate epimerase [Nesterenkonia sphaerica]